MASLEYDDDDISTQPFAEIQPIFSRGLWRNPIKFVPASSSLPPPSHEESTSPKPLSIAEQYLAIVFPNGQPKKPEPDTTYPICEICNKPVKRDELGRPHTLSLDHQLALPRKAPPSNIDRSRMGLKYLEKHGFDVDSGKGLGAAGEGILYPIKAVEKRDTYGLGIRVGKKAAPPKPKEILNAGAVRKKVTEDKEKAAKLQRMFYGDDKVEEYLAELESHSQPKSAELSLGGFKVTRRRRR